MSQTLNVLLIEDSDDDAALVLRELGRHYKVQYRRVETAADMEAALEQDKYEIVLSDFALPQFSGMDALQLLKNKGSDLPFILVSGTIGEEAAVEALKAGAHDYVLKGRLARLHATIDRALADTLERRRRRETEEALQQSEERLRQLQKLDAIGNLAGGIAHDFNNLLTVILGHSELMLMRLKQDDALRRDVEMIMKTGERAAALTRQLLAFSRRQPLKPQVISINSLIEDHEKMLRRVIVENIQIITNLAARHDRIKADPSQIEQVLLNLALNARDAMSKGGKLVIETSDVMLDDEYVKKHVGAASGPHVLLAVSDTGEGMSAEVQERIFEPFFTTKEKGKGTGLGLATVYGIVKQSGGNIWVYSQLGRGTTFKIYLPRVTENVSAPPPKAPASGEHKKVASEVILLVEDEDDLRELVRNVLTMRGFRVLECRDGQAALDTCQRFSGAIDVVLTDVVMPKMSGQELISRIKPLRPEMKVLYMSGYTATALASQGSGDAPVFFLEKPFTPDLLVRRLNEVLGR